MLRPFCLFLVLFSLLALAHPAPAQSTDFVAALSGDKHPLTLKLKDLDSSWRRMTVMKAASIGAISDAYYTHGETVTVGSEAFLVSYHCTQTPVELNALLSGTKSLPLPMTPDTLLTLSLINVRQISSLDDIRPNTPEVQNQALNQAEAGTEVTAEDKSVENLKQIGMALMQYSQDYDEVLPPMKTVAEADETIYPYLKDRKLFEHPDTHELYQVNTSLSHRTLASFNDPATMVTYYEASTDADGLRAVLFLDGNVKRVCDPEWQKLKTASHVPNPPPAAPVPKGGGG